MAKPTRRTFLKASALAFPAVVGLNARVRAQAAREGKLGVALCGLGGFSEKSIAPEFPFAGNVWFAGAITGDPQGKGRAWAAKHGFPESNLFTYADMARLAECRDIDIVHVVTPNGLHAEHTIAAARAGKHVLCEKPMATSAAQCAEMIAEAGKAGVRLGVDYRLHFEPHHREMMRLASERTYGAVKAVTAEFSWKRGDNKPWLLDKKLAGGGAAFDTGVYAVQAGSYITGETPAHASAVPTTTRDVYPAGIEETMSFTLEYPGGAVLQGRAGYAYGAHQFDVFAEKGAFSCTVPPGGGSIFGQSVNGKPGPRQVVLPGGKIFKKDDTLQLAVTLDEFAAAVREKRDFACPGEMGRRDVRILEAVCRSAARNGERVPI